MSTHGSAAEDTQPRALTAVGYLRRSTDRQEQSLGDQRAAIERHAAALGIRVVRYYEDDAISGTRSDTRPAFQRLIRDAQTPRCPFGVVLVYDVKRFGRVDNDEAGHYRWILRQHGVNVIYVAEGFLGGSIDDLIRPVKQWQAREESRDLSRVTARGMLSKAAKHLPLGIWLGGFPPHGYDLRCETGDGGFRFIVRYMPDGSKHLLDERGQVREVLPRRQPHIVAKTDRARLVLSDTTRVEAIRLVYRLRVEAGLRPQDIARELNRLKVPTARGTEWSDRCSGLWRPTTIENILRNPVYMGDLVWNRRTLARFHRIATTGPIERADALIRRTSPNPQQDWVVVRGCHEAIVDGDLWVAAQ